MEASGFHLRGFLDPPKLRFAVYTDEKSTCSCFNKIYILEPIWLILGSVLGAFGSDLQATGNIWTPLGSPKVPQAAPKGASGAHPGSALDPQGSTKAFPTPPRARPSQQNESSEVDFGAPETTFGVHLVLQMILSRYPSCKVEVSKL